MSRLGKESNERYIKPVVDAGSAIALASACEPRLRRHYADTGGAEFDDARALARRSR